MGYFNIHCVASKIVSIGCGSDGEWSGYTNLESKGDLGLKGCAETLYVHRRLFASREEVEIEQMGRDFVESQMVRREILLRRKNGSIAMEDEIVEV